jgi:hypothetical protein
MRLTLRITDQLLHEMHRDLDRPHHFAGERVGFLSCGVGALPGKALGIYAALYHPVADDDYLPDSQAAAMLGPGAFRKILQRAYNNHGSILHVHRHDHVGEPIPSGIDDSESRRFIPDFWKVCPNYPHGTLILSLDSMWGQLWIPGNRKIYPFEKYCVVGRPLRTIGGKGT